MRRDELVGRFGRLKLGRSLLLLFTWKSSRVWNIRISKQHSKGNN